MFIVLSIIFCVLTIKVWRNYAYKDLKSNLVAVTLGAVAFNSILALILLLYALETNPANIAIELTQNQSTLITMLISIANVGFYSVFCVLFLTSSRQTYKRV